MSEGDGQDEEQNEKTNWSTNLPEIAFAPIGLSDTFEIHAKVRREEWQWQENGSHTGQDEDSFVLRVCVDGKLVLFDGFKVEKLHHKPRNSLAMIEVNEDADGD